MCQSAGISTRRTNLLNVKRYLKKKKIFFIIIVVVNRLLYINKICTKLINSNFINNDKRKENAVRNRLLHQPYENEMKNNSRRRSVADRDGVKR